MRKQGESEADYTAMLIQDLSQMQQDCAEQLGWLPTCFTYPFGQISPEALPILSPATPNSFIICIASIVRTTPAFRQSCKKLPPKSLTIFLLLHKS